MVDFLKFRSTPSGSGEGKKHIVIVGAGIIGVCISYYIVTHPKFDPNKYHITIIESKRVAGGASGKAGGLLALWAFPSQLVPLSFKLHDDLAKKYNGEEEWGYRRLSIVSLEGDISHVADTDSEEEVSSDSNSIDDTYKKPAQDSDTSTSTSEKPPKKSARLTKSRTRTSIRSRNKLPEDLNWITSSLIDSCSKLGGVETTAQVHPYRFTTYILKKAVEESNGALELILGQVKEIKYSMTTGEATGVSYMPTSAKNESIEGPITINGDQIVLSVGPWTSKILPDCPISGLRAHSITIAPYQNQPVSPYAIFTEFKTGPSSYISPEIYARQDEVYVCGEGDSAVDVPETTDDVQVVKSKCDELFKQVGKISNNLKKGQILRRQACYLPVLDVPSSSGPLIGETNVSKLYLASGHSCWGINNAPATGKVMSELLMDGKASSTNISSLDPSLYFDASILLSDSEYGFSSGDDDHEAHGDVEDDNGEETS